MTQDDVWGPTETVARRVRELRRKRGLSAAALADLMSAAGVPWDRSIVANLENGRRHSVTVVELLALSAVLNVAPVHLLVPLDDGGRRYQVTPRADANVMTVRNWVRGVCPVLPGQSQRDYLAEIPEGEFMQVTRTFGGGDGAG